MLSLINITKTYTTKFHHLNVLKNINLTVKAGEMIAITGTSGSGKTTLLNIIGLLDTYNNGHYLINGEPMDKITEIKAAYYRNMTFGFIFQNANLIAHKNIVENVALPLLYRQIPSKQRNALAYEYLQQLGLSKWYNHYPNELSGGQKQRVAIARAIITEPKVILADEPTGQLDSQNSSDVLKLLKAINQEQGTTIIVVTHDLSIAKQYKKIIQLVDGQILD